MIDKRRKHIVVIAQHGCPPCHTLIEYLIDKKHVFDVIYLSDENTKDVMHYTVFNTLWPDSPGTPHVLIDGVYVRDPINFLELDM